jgi:hypothetical protein
MIVTIDLDERLRIRLEQEARRRGLQPPEYARQLVEQGLRTAAAATGPDRATLDLLAEWEREDATNDPAELEARRSELEALKQALNDNRPTGRKPFPQT